MGFSHLFILQLRSWPRSLEPPDLESGFDLFDLLLLDLLLYQRFIFGKSPLCSDPKGLGQAVILHSQ